ncbi:MAG: hypothetical protein QXR53_04340 [Candidatus Norongarragalinales archaeon]
MTIEKFEILKEKTAHTNQLDPKMASTKIWASTNWEQLKKSETEEILFPFLNFQFERAKKTMPAVYKPYSERKIKLTEFNDLEKIPALVKDTTNNLLGLREKIERNPYIMQPADISTGLTIYKSGGTRGVATPTFITEWDEKVEAQGLKKCFEYMGISQKDTVLNMYNPTHKGGQCIRNAMLMIGLRIIPRRTTDTAKEIVDTIDDYGITVLASVQGPLNEGDKTKKGGGVDFLSLIEVGQDILEDKLQTLFITGYTLIPELVSWAETHEKKLATVLGSTEAIPQSTSTIPGGICKYNNQHLINGTHYVEILKQESKQLVPVKRGEIGILAYTTIAREGTIYIRYAPGDSAKLVANGGECDCGIKTPIISDIRRIDIPEDTIAAGCCIG